MRYFLGVARKHFPLDGPDSALRAAGWSVENLLAQLHKEGSPCRGSAPPLFHTGSIVTLTADLRNPEQAQFTVEVDTTGAVMRTSLPASLASVVFWVSLYNRFAQFTILDD
eukprot:gnl/TRDRNA2_/TRDRNA2_54410_c0_seq1.p4 gnl/TRDRNA2_/TRDRNA2_54410_c0~~gnl/TRDRNA2_/TRDRNA2_54410_c0_seq1.p4  ORF type:complete len:111 (-),score=11.26 gnl/TRDRNA2_/TRDRNA2_54410_c0_seq1:258-590(-)